MVVVAPKEALAVTVRALRVVVAPKEALAVTVRALMVVVAPKEALAVTVRALRVVVPVVVRAPETVTLRPAPDVNTRFDVAEIWIFDVTVLIDPNWTRVGAPVNTARMKIPEPPLRPLPPPDPVFAETTGPPTEPPLP
jgi:hypothetical protein